MGEEIFTFLREPKYSVSLITVPFCPVAPCPFQILAGVLVPGECFFLLFFLCGKIAGITAVWGKIQQWWVN